jgi:alkyldihydroxyacetonephosphate synthase
MTRGPASTAEDPGRTPMVWHGWGDATRRSGLSPSARAALTDALGPLDPPIPPVALDQVRVGPSRLAPAARAALVQVTGPDGVRDDHRTRVEHAGGRSYPDLVRRRQGDAVAAPDAVVLPRSRAEVDGLLAACGAHRVALVPFGGGTSVVGGVEPERGGFDAVVAIDLRRLDQLVSLDATSQLATFEAGIRAPVAEAALRARGYTLGHYPQSYGYATIGGMVATRSAGQASTGYGRIDELVVAATWATPAGELTTGGVARSAAGPDLRALLVGSEGAFGILTEVTLRVRPLPETEHHEAWVLPSFASGAAALRALVQAGVAADITRLSDEDETATTLAQAGGWKVAALRRYLGVRGLERPCLLILGWEGASAGIDRRRSRATEVLRPRRAVRIGSSAGRAWARHRFEGPYLRDDLLDHGVMVETLETAATWSQLGGLYLGVRGAIGRTLADLGTPPLVLCHVSHLYPTGASLYFTWLARQQRGAELAQWQAVKQAAGDAIVANHGTITHHHAVGLDHRAWMEREVGSLGLEVLRAVKQQLDPTGILNPGKLLPDPSASPPIA